VSEGAIRSVARTAAFIGAASLSNFHVRPPDWSDIVPVVILCIVIGIGAAIGWAD
jgi:hypothetical protein